MEIGYCESEYEAALMDLLSSLGWCTSSGDELHRKYSEVLILDDLRSFLQQRHPDFTPDEQERIVFNLSNTGGDTDYLSLRATASLCVNGFTFSRDDLSLPNEHVDYIDFENLQANIFRAVNQLTTGVNLQCLGANPRSLQARHSLAHEVLLVVSDQRRGQHKAWNDLCTVRALLRMEES